MFTQIKPARAIFFLAVTLMTALPVLAAEPELPATGISREAATVIWIDVAGCTDGALSTSLDAITKVVPAATKDPEGLAEAKGNMAAGEAVCADLLDAGVSAAVLAIRPSRGAAPAAPDDEASDVQAFLRATPEADPAAVKAILIRHAEKQPAIKPADLEEIKNVTVSRLNQDWLALSGPGLLPTAAADVSAQPEPFLALLKQDADAAFRLAWLVDDATRASIDAALLEPGAFLFAGILTPLRSLQTGRGGIWVGEAPKLAMDFTFAAEADAQQFQQGLQGAAMMVSNMMAMGGGDAEGQKKQEKMRALMTLVMLQQDGASVSKTIDTATLARLAAAGVFDEE